MKVILSYIIFFCFQERFHGSFLRLNHAMTRAVMSSVVIFVLLILPLTSHHDLLASEDSSARMMVHLLDYLDRDYGGAVEGGNVINEAEYEEQVEFIGTAKKLFSIHPLLLRNVVLQEKLELLNQAILNKRHAKEVSELSRSAQRLLIQTVKLNSEPLHWPNLEKGKNLFTKNCIVCHGKGGEGDGAGAGSLNPKPTNLTLEQMKEVTPFQIFNSIRMGIPGTAMVAFQNFRDEEIWDLAFYVSNLRFLRELKSERSAPVTHGSVTLAAGFLNSAHESYQQGKKELAGTQALSAYLEGVEPIENLIRASDPKLLNQLEVEMAGLRAAIQKDADPAMIQRSFKIAQETLSKVDKILKTQEISPQFVFLASLGIILREGLESVLMILALLGLVKALNLKKVRIWIHGGWILAIGVGFLFWIYSGWLIQVSVFNREIMEAAISFIAVAVLIFLGVWLHGSQEIHRWKTFIQSKFENNASAGSLLGLGFFSFIAVFREAFETVLFLRALTFEATVGVAGGGGGANPLLVWMSAGVVVGVALLSISSFFALRWSVRLPLAKLFNVLAVLMSILAVVLAGKGVHSLQEVGLVHASQATLPVRFELLGIFPTTQSQLTQGLVILLIIVLVRFKGIRS